MGEAADNLTQWENSSFSLASISPVYTFRRTDTITARNMMTGAFGIVFNTIAIIFLALKKRVKLTLKITMLGMAINDLIFTANGLVLSNPNWTWVSHEPYCWPVMYLMASAILISYFITTLLALHNYVAVVYPFNCDEIMTRSRSVMGVLACFTGGYLVVLGCLGVNLPPRVLCSVFTLMSRAGIAVECAFCLVNCSVIVALNVVISLKIKESRSTAKYGINKTLKVSNEDKINFLTRKKTEKGSLKSDEAIPNNELTTICGGGFVRDSGSPRTEKRHLTSLKNGFNKDILSVSEQLNTTNGQMCPSLGCKHSNDVCSRESIEDLTRRVSSEGELSTQSPSPFNPMYSVVKLKLKSTPLGGVANKLDRPKQPIRRVKTSKTLMILTFWSCLMSLPFMVFMVYVSFLAPDRQSFTTSDMGVFMVWLCTIHSIGNPLLFIWRFIDWKKVRRQVNARLRR